MAIEHDGSSASHTLELVNGTARQRAVAIVFGEGDEKILLDALASQEALLLLEHRS